MPSIGIIERKFVAMETREKIVSESFKKRYAELAEKRPDKWAFLLAREGEPASTKTKHIRAQSARGPGPALRSNPIPGMQLLSSPPPQRRVSTARLSPRGGSRVLRQDARRPVSAHPLLRKATARRPSPLDMRAASPEGRDEKPASAAYSAARRGDWDLLAEVLADDQSKLSYKPRSGRTCLHFAAMAGRDDVVDYLLGLEAADSALPPTDPEHPGETAQTILFQQSGPNSAARAREFGLMQSLLQCPRKRALAINWKARCGELAGRACLHHAAVAGRQDVCLWLHRHGALDCPLPSTDPGYPGQTASEILQERTGYSLLLENERPRHAAWAAVEETPEAKAAAEPCWEMKPREVPARCALRERSVLSRLGAGRGGDLGRRREGPGATQVVQAEPVGDVVAEPAPAASVGGESTSIGTSAEAVMGKEPVLAHEGGDSWSVGVVMPVEVEVGEAQQEPNEEEGMIEKTRRVRFSVPGVQEDS